MKKKYPLTSRDKEDWVSFTKELNEIRDKDVVESNDSFNKILKLDLHGFSLNDANKAVKKFITEAFENGYKNLIIITGKGLRSKIQKDPYISSKLGVLKHSVPEFIRNEQDLINKVKKISSATLQQGGEGALHILLKNKK